jgi:tRNA threonylcarbamoyl adenosine modification protein YeaZ
MVEIDRLACWADVKLLAIDTATPRAAVVLHPSIGGAERRLEPRSAFRDCVPAIEDLLTENDVEWDQLDGLAIPRGPGSFTGLRIGATIAIALAELRGINLYAPSTLLAVAELCARPDQSRVCATFDARRGRSYAAVCERGDSKGWRLVHGPADLEPDRITTFARGATEVRLEDTMPEIGTIAAAIGSLVEQSPGRYRVADASRFELDYARPGVDVS